MIAKTPHERLDWMLSNPGALFNLLSNSTMSTTETVISELVSGSINTEKDIYKFDYKYFSPVTGKEETSEIMCTSKESADKLKEFLALENQSTGDQHEI